MSTHNIGFYEEISKLSLNYHQISPNTHLISSAGRVSVNGFSSLLLFFVIFMSSRPPLPTTMSINGSF